MTKLRPYQLEGVAGIHRFEGRMLLADQPGLGKQQPVTSPVLTPDGWKPIGKLKPGDTISASDGRSQMVAGVFPQGRKEAFAVVFSDGSRVECGESHLWAVRNTNGTSRHRNPVILTTKEIAGRLHEGWEVPLPSPVHFRHRGAPPIPPYLLGVLIGDGSLTNAGVSFVPGEGETPNEVAKVLPDWLEVRRNTDYGTSTRYGVCMKLKKKTHPYRDQLKKWGLAVRGEYKFIPQEYLFSSIKDRKELLRGLMDTDGTCNGCRLRYQTTSPKLAADVLHLIRSLGGLASASTYHPTRPNEMPLHTVCFSRIGNPFTDRKVDPPRSTTRKTVVSITPIGKLEQVCIAVSSKDHLYITQDFTLTHNTIQALDWIRRTPKHRPAVVVCPASVKYNWQAEAHLHFGMHATILEGSPRDRRDVPAGNLIVLNYDILKEWLPGLLKRSPPTVIFDECHFLSHGTAQRTKAAIMLADQARSVVGLSGTPMTNQAIQLWSVLRVIKPDLFPNHGKFAWRYTKPILTRYGWKFKGARNADELNEILYDRVMIRRLKQDVAKEIPDKIHQTVYLELTGEPREEYRRAEKDFLSWLRNISPQRALRASRVEAMAKIGYLLRLAAELKHPETVKWVKEFFHHNPGEKLVALTSHTAVIERMQAAFPQAVTINGAVTGKLRNETARRFQSNKHCQLLLGNWKAIVGMNFQAAADLVALDLPWTPGDVSQGQDRIHRIGQTRTCFIRHLIARGTAEERQMHVLRGKEKTLDAILDGHRNGGGGDILGDLIEDLNHNH